MWQVTGEVQHEMDQLSIPRDHLSTINRKEVGRGGGGAVERGNSKDRGEEAKEAWVA